jgi:hypothetical protein
MKDRLGHLPMLGEPWHGLRACSSVRLERTPDKREVDGSTPSRPTISTEIIQYELFRGCSSAGRAPALHAGGHRFDPVHLHQKQYKVSCDILFLVEMAESFIFVL